MEHRTGIVKIEELAKYFNRRPQAISKAVLRGQLPRPVQVSDVRVWTWESIIRHIAKREREQEASRKGAASPHVIELCRPGQKHHNP